LPSVLVDKASIQTFITQNSKLMILFRPFKYYLAVFVFMSFGLALKAQQLTYAEEVDAIKSMCGCYEVSFNFAETFHYVTDSTVATSAEKHDTGLEYVIRVEDEQGKIALQHLLIVGPPQEQHVIKHWRQDWLYEAPNLYSFEGDNFWKFQSYSKDRVAGKWTQKVYQVDDSPRYEGLGNWISINGKTWWESNTDAPLPRREYTKRSDYNVMNRTNRHYVEGNRWIHDQDNIKIRRSNGKDLILAEEKGKNIYTKTSEKSCQAAIDYWNQNQAYWKKVRSAWDNIFQQSIDLKIMPVVDGTPMHKKLFGALETNPEITVEEIQKMIEDYLVEEKGGAVGVGR
jgi:hypothetical protein